MERKEFYKISQNEKDILTRKIADFLRQQENISFAYIFGSFLEPEQISFRDIDVAVFLKPLTINREQIFDYECDLARKLSKKISFPFDLLDVKILNFAPSGFQNNIFSRGKLLFAKESELLSDMIEETSLEAVANYKFKEQSLRELVSV